MCPSMPVTNRIMSASRLGQQKARHLEHLANQRRRGLAGVTGTIALPAMLSQSANIPAAARHQVRRGKGLTHSLPTW